jgi:hypothetical protein
MSLAIDTNAVTAVLLADGWHTVRPGTFDVDAYEYKEDGLLVLTGGQNSGVASVGFTFHTEDGKERIAGPLTAILAVKTRARKLSVSGT